MFSIVLDAFTYDIVTTFDTDEGIENSMVKQFAQGQIAKWSWGLNWGFLIFKFMLDS